MLYLWLIAPTLGLILSTRAYLDATRGDAIVRAGSDEYLVRLYSRARVTRELWRVPMQAMIFAGFSFYLLYHKDPSLNPVSFPRNLLLTGLSAILDRQSIADWLLAQKVRRRLRQDFIALRGPAPTP